MTKRDPFESVESAREYVADLRRAAVSAGLELPDVARSLAVGAAMIEYEIGGIVAGKRSAFSAALITVIARLQEYVRAACVEHRAMAEAEAAEPGTMH